MRVLVVVVVFVSHEKTFSLLWLRGYTKLSNIWNSACIIHFEVIARALCSSAVPKKRRKNWLNHFHIVFLPFCKYRVRQYIKKRIYHTYIINLEEKKEPGTSLLVLYKFYYAIFPSSSRKQNVIYQKTNNTDDGKYIYIHDRNSVFHILCAGT